MVGPLRPGGMAAAQPAAMLAAALAVLAALLAPLALAASDEQLAVERLARKQTCSWKDYGAKAVVYEPAGPAFNEVESKFDWRKYRLRAADSSCQFPFFDRPRIEQCASKRWLISFGSSNPMAMTSAMQRLVLGPEYEELSFPPPPNVNDFLEMIALHHVAVNYSDPKRAPPCIDDFECMQELITEKNGNYGYFSGQLVNFVASSIDFVNSLNFTIPFSEDFPTGEILFQCGNWDNECKRGGFTSGDKVCVQNFQTIEHSNLTYNELVASQFEEFLAAVRDKMPFVHRVHVDVSYPVMAKLPEVLTPEYLDSQGYPLVNYWDLDNFTWDYDMIGTERVDGHYAFPNSIGKMHWLLNAMCQDEEFPAETTTDVIHFQDNCYEPEFTSWHQLSTWPCSYEIEKVGVAPLGPDFDAADISLVDPLVLNPLPTNDTDGLPFQTIYTSYSRVYTPYHIGLVAGSAVVLAVGAVAFFQPKVISLVWKYTGLTCVTTTIGRATQPAFDKLEHVLVRIRTTTWNACAAALCCPCIVLKKCRKTKDGDSDIDIYDIDRWYPDVPSESRGYSPKAAAESFVVAEVLPTDAFASDTGADELALTDSASRPTAQKASASHPVAQRASASDSGSTGPQVGADQPYSANTTSFKADTEDIEQAPANATSFPDQRREAATTSKKIKIGGKMRALGMARFIASVHIVIGHLYVGRNNLGTTYASPLDDLQTNGWGFSWVPFFMMLSGFVLTYARLNSRNPDKLEHWQTFTWKRIRGIYPLYLCGLLARGAQDAALFCRGFSLGTPLETVASLFLLQAWLPNITIRVVQMHCWFLSCIVPYWALHQRMYTALRKWSTRSLWILMFCVPAVPTLLLTAVPVAAGSTIYWYKAFDGWTMTTWEDYLVVALKFHPLCYLHIYVFGMAGAIMLQRYDELPTGVQVVFRNGAWVGLFSLYFIFGISGVWTFPAHKLTCRLGLLAPLQGLFLIGLAAGVDPVAQLFSLELFQPLENLSYPQYVFQFIAFFNWESWMDVGFFVWLAGLSLLGYYFVQKPLRSKSTPFVKQLGGFFSIFILAGLIAVLARFFADDILSQHFVDAVGEPLPSRVAFDDGTQDIRISTEIKDRLSCKLYNSVINPSVMWIPSLSQLWYTARAHRFDARVTGRVEELTWYSDVVVGQLDPETFEPLGPSQSISQLASFSWWPCEDVPYLFVPANGTRTRTVTTGPEDPRFLLDGDKLVLTTNMNHPKSIVQPDIGCWVPRRMIANTIDLNSGEYSRATLLQDPEQAVFSTEKNWLAFKHRGQLKYVRSIMPFSVVYSTEEGSTPEQDRAATVVESVEYDYNLFIAMSGSDVEIHGGANPLSFIHAENGTLVYSESDVDGDDAVYIGVFHTRSSKGEYANFLFQFSFNEERSTWRIERVSQELDLLEAPVSVSNGVTMPMTFLSGMTVVPNGVLFSYGSSNAESRLRLMPWEVFFSYF